MGEDSTNPAAARDFGFVAGRERSHVAATSDGGVVDEMVAAMAILLDWRRVSAFRCIAELRFASDPYECELIARPRELSYDVVDLRTGARNSFDPTTGELHEGSARRLIDASQLNWEHLAARLAFPMSLGIWGRPRDSYRWTGATRGEDELVVSLVHQQDPALTGSLTIDLARRTALRLDTPTLGIEYRDVQPA